MKAALLCPGPSLLAFNEAPRYDLTIGVNRAVLAFPCDWWAVQDWQLFGDTHPDGNPAVFTTLDCMEAIRRHGGSYRLAHRLLRYIADVYFYEPAPDYWALYTATAALILAWDQGATSITCYGCDREGVDDYDGTSRTSDNRTDERWQRESRIWRDVVIWLRDHGMRVHE